MSDRLAAYVRTYYPLVLGHLAALAVAWISAKFGIVVDSLLIFELLAVGMTAAIYAAGESLTRLDGDSPWARLARGLGRWLVSLGLDTGTPTYGQPPAETTTAFEYGAGGELRTVRSVTTWPPSRE